jgi:hypothetical protein
MASENREIIEAAATVIALRSPDGLHVSAPANWREIDLQYDAPAHLVVRLTPAGDNATAVEVFQREALLAAETLRGYRSADGLADLIEGVHRRAIERA